MAVCRIGCVDRVDLVVARRAQRARRVEGRLPRELEVLRGDRRAVFPRRVRVDLERDRERVLGDAAVVERRLLGEQRRRLVAAVVRRLPRAGHRRRHDRPLHPRRVGALGDDVDALGPLLGTDGDRAARRRAISRSSSCACSGSRRTGAAAGRSGAASGIIAAARGRKQAETEQQGERLDAPRGSSHVMDLLVSAWGDGARLPLQRRPASEHVIRPAGTARQRPAFDHWVEAHPSYLPLSRADGQFRR